MTFILNTYSKRVTTFEEYKEMKRRLIMNDYRMTRDYDTASHFNKAGAEVVLIKEFAKEVLTNGRT